MLRVVKVGGSLLDWSDLPTALTRWLNQQPSATNVLICGGGKLADSIRKADQQFHLGDETAHWLAIDCLSITAKLLAQACNFPLLPLIPKLRLAAQAPEAPLRDPQPRQSSDMPSTIVLDPRDFLHHIEPTIPGPPLPHAWTVTSDSIAARLAQALAADELILLKSSSPPSKSLDELAAAGYVDLHFPIAAAHLTALQFVNLPLSSNLP
jgi:aspartokinase-like uncharacterized kinase